MNSKKESHNEYQKRWAKNNPEKVKANSTKWYQNNPEKAKAQQERAKQKRIMLRKIVLEYYGGNPPKCACCGESNYEFLVIDHINGGGTKHINEFHGTITYYTSILKTLPDNLQVLCANCNTAKGTLKQKYCPVHHPREEVKSE